MKYLEAKSYETLIKQSSIDIDEMDEELKNPRLRKPSLRLNGIAGKKSQIRQCLFFLWEAGLIEIKEGEK